MSNQIKKFETGNTYSCNSVCDSNCWWHFEILKRTAKSVWIKIEGKIVRRSIYIYSDSEQFKPFGSYSFAPIVRAGKW